MKKSVLRTAFTHTLPVMTGYLVLGIGFGILLQEKGHGILWSLAMSVFIYAGSMQYLAVSLLTGGVSLVTAALTTLMVNARHRFYAISMLERYRGAGKEKPYLIFALTDETYSLVSSRPPQGVSYHRYCLLVSVLDHCYWIAGSVLGSLLGNILPISFEGVDFALTALFVTIFVEQWLSTKDHRPALIGVMSTFVCLLLFGSQIFLIPSMALIAGLLLLLPRTGKEASHE